MGLEHDIMNYQKRAVYQPLNIGSTHSITYCKSLIFLASFCNFCLLNSLFLKSCDRKYCAVNSLSLVLHILDNIDNSRFRILCHHFYPSNHKNYIFLDCNWFKKLVFSSYSRAKLLSNNSICHI